MCAELCWKDIEKAKLAGKGEALLLAFKELHDADIHIGGGVAPRTTLGRHGAAAPGTGSGAEGHVLGRSSQLGRPQLGATPRDIEAERQAIIAADRSSQAEEMGLGANPDSWATPGATAGALGQARDAASARDEQSVEEFLRAGRVETPTSGLLGGARSHFGSTGRAAPPTVGSAVGGALLLVLVVGAAVAAAKHRRALGGLLHANSALVIARVEEQRQARRARREARIVQQEGDEGDEGDEEAGIHVASSADADRRGCNDEATTPPQRGRGGGGGGGGSSRNRPGHVRRDTKGKAVEASEEEQASLTTSSAAHSTRSKPSKSRGKSGNKK